MEFSQLQGLTDIYARVDSKQKWKVLENAHIDITPQNNSDKLWEKGKVLIKINWKIVEKTI